MANDAGQLLNDIGNMLARDTAYPLDGTFLYVEASEGWVDISIFKDLGDHVLWRDSDKGLTDALIALWSAEPARKRWSSMCYRITGTSFDASFTYHQLDRNVSSMERRRPILQQLFGDKRIVYPPLP